MKYPIFEYGSDGTKVVRKNREVVHIHNNVYRGETITDEYSNTYCPYYVIFPGVETGMKLSHIANPDEYSQIEWVYLAEHIEKDYPIASPEDFIAVLDRRAEGKQFIGNIQIALASLIAPEKTEIYREARKAYYERRSKEEAERKAEEAAEDAAYVKEQNEIADKLIAETVEKIKTGGVVENKEITLYKSRYDYSSYKILNHLARLYNVKIPLRTQGWINEHLGQITVENGEITSLRRSGKKCSEVIWKYMNELIKAVNAASEKETA